MIVSGQVIKGYQVASGLAVDHPFEAGTIDLQKPVFKERGLSLDHCYSGTMNVLISPKTFTMINPRYRFDQVEWGKGKQVENFSFSPCILYFEDQKIEAFVYYPHPETKKEHFQDNDRLEILAPKVGGISYGSSVRLELNDQEIQIS